MDRSLDTKDTDSDYEDALGAGHRSTFCFFIDNGGRLRYCREGNDKDRNPEVSQEKQIQPAAPPPK